MRSVFSSLFPTRPQSETSYDSTRRPFRSSRRQRDRRLHLESLERRQLLAAEVLQVTVENLSENDGVAQTPFWVAVHDGNFDLADAGQPAASFGGLELIAEEGDPSGLIARFAAEGNGNDGVILAPDGFAGAPVFEPGETVSQSLTVDDTSQFQYFSFASMVIPSNDAFIANIDSRSFRLFDNVGDFLGPRTIVIYGSAVYDAGTEVNDSSGGAAFAIAGGTSVDEGGVIMPHLGLDDFVGAALPTGNTLGKAFGANTPIARITIARASDPSNAIDGSGPLAALQASDLSTRVDFHEITVTYSDPSGIDLGSIDTDNLRITGPLLTPLNVLSVTVDSASGTVPAEVTATYRVAPVTGSFTALDNGTYSVVLLENQVNDPFGHASESQLLGEFAVDAPVQLNVTFESLGDVGGLAQTPLWIGSHNGSFEIARAGSPASDFGGLEELAEGGDLNALITRFAAESGGTDSVIFAPDGFAGAPVFEPGEIVTRTLDVADPLSNRYFSYASMVIPSNDAFIANLDPRAIELFDRFGDFTGSRTITIYGQDIWDSGTEVNDPSGGAAFSTEGGVSSDEGGVVHRHLGLDDFVGTGLPTGEDLGSAFGNMTPIGRITISLSDHPADPIDNRGPLATADIPAVNVSGQATHDVRVTYSDASGIDLTSIDSGDISIISSAGQELQVVSVTTDAVSNDQRTVTATYQVAPIDGQPFSTFDNGLYFVSLNGNEVGDMLGNEASVLPLGSFEVLLAVELEVSIENLSVDGGLAQTPFWIAIHEGNFAIGAAGTSASEFGGLEEVAEDGDVSVLGARFAAESDGSAEVVLAPDGFAGAPVFEPGEVAISNLSVFDTNANRFFSFASMIIPSNDAFLANLNPRQYELFDQDGFFNGERSITIYGRDVWDAGTEVNAADGGAAFSTLGGDSTDEDGLIRRHDGLDAFIGTGLPTGENLAAAFTEQTPLARITIRLAGGGGQPIDRAGPTATLSSDPVTTAGVASHEIQVTYSDPAGVDLTTIGVDDLTVRGPLGNELNVTGFSSAAATATAPRSVTVTYTLATDDGQFTARDNGRYFVSLVDDAVRDTFGQSSDATTLDAFSVDVGIRVQVEIASLTSAGGLAQTPFWVGFHNGEFEVARGGLPASQFGGLELIAETGDPSELAARFDLQSSGTATVIAAPDGFAGAPVFEPGEVVSQVIEIDETIDNRFFSYASMVIPSNDAFVANLNPTFYELFDSRGNFKGARQITIYGRHVLDAGTEINDPVGGAAYSTGGGVGADEGGVIHSHAGLDEFVGTGVPTGETLESAFNSFTALATITISLFDPESQFCSGVDAACSSRSVSLTNAQLSTDVNRDGRVSALDALLVVNFLGRFGSQSTVSDEAQRTGLHLDVGADSEVSSVDALLVINELVRRSSSPQSAEGEVSERIDSAISELATVGFTDVAIEDDTEEAIAMLF